MKKRTFNDLLLLPLACVPYAFLGMYGDRIWGTPLLYLTLLVPAALCMRWQRRNFGRLVLVGNGVSALLSGLLSWWLLSAQDAYFKPFGVLGFFAFLTLLSWIVQYLIWYRKRTKTPDQALIYTVCLTALLLIAGVFLLLYWKAGQIGAFA